MNIMRLDEDPVKAARFHPDTVGDLTSNYTGRMCYEATHIACNAVRKNGYAPDFIYGKSHYNHPICIWAAEAYENFKYVWELGEALNVEYMERTGKTEPHGSWEVLRQLDPDPEIFPQIEATEQPQCFGENDHLRRDDPVTGYKLYWANVKGPKAKWENVSKPDFIAAFKAPQWALDSSVRTATDEEEEDDTPDTGLMSFKS